MTLSHTEVLAGTETIALEVRDRRMPDRLLERDVLARGVDYQLDPAPARCSCNETSAASIPS